MYPLLIGSYERLDLMINYAAVYYLNVMRTCWGGIMTNGIIYHWVEFKPTDEGLDKLFDMGIIIEPLALRDAER